MLNDNAADREENPLLQHSVNTDRLIQTDTPKTLTAIATIRQLSIRSMPYLFKGSLLVAQIIGKSMLIASRGQYILAGMALVVSIENPLLAFYFEGLGAITKRVAQAAELDADNPKKIQMIYRQAVIFSFGLSVCAAPICLFSKDIFRLCGQPNDSINEVGSFFYAALPAYFIDMHFRILESIMMGLKQPLSPMIFEMVEGGVDIVACYFFVFGVAGLPEMGVTGAACAYLCASIITAVMYMVYLGNRQDLKQYALFSCQGPFFDKGIFKSLCADMVLLGGSASVQMLMQMIVTFFCGLQGKHELVAIQVSNMYRCITDFTAASFSTPAIVAIEESSKTEMLEQRNKHILASMLLPMLCSLLFFSIAAAIPSDIARLLLVNKNAKNEDALLSITSNILLLQAGMQVLNAGFINAFVNGPAAALSKTLIPFLTICFGLLGVNLVSSAIATFGYQADAETIFNTQFAGLGLTALILLGYLVHLVQGKNSFFQRAKISVASQRDGFWRQKPGDNTDGQAVISVSANPVIAV